MILRPFTAIIFNNRVIACLQLVPDFKMVKLKKQTFEETSKFGKKNVTNG